MNEYKSKFEEGQRCITDFNMQKAKLQTENGMFLLKNENMFEDSEIYYWNLSNIHTNIKFFFTEEKENTMKCLYIDIFDLFEQKVVNENIQNM